MRVPRLKTSSQAVGQFRRAHAFWHFRAYERCIPLLEDLILDHPHHPVTEMGGALLLDALKTTERDAELVMWLDLIVHIEGFLDDKPQLRATVREYRRRVGRPPVAQNENVEIANEALSRPDDN